MSKKPDTPKIDWARIDATTDADIARQNESDPDAVPELSDAFFDKATLVRPNKVQR